MAKKQRKVNIPLIWDAQRFTLIVVAVGLAVVALLWPSELVAWIRSFDPLVWVALIAVMGYFINGLVKNWLHWKNRSYDKKLDAYTSWGESTYMIGRCLQMKMAIRKIPVSITTPEDVFGALQPVRRLFQTAALDERGIGSDHIGRMRDHLNEFILEEAKKGTESNLSEWHDTLVLVLSDIDDLYTNWCSLYIDQALKSLTVSRLLSKNNRLVIAAANMTSLVGSELDWLHGTMLGGETPAIKDEVDRQHRTDYGARLDILTHVLREDLHRNRTPLLKRGERVMLDATLAEAAARLQKEARPRKGRRAKAKKPKKPKDAQ
jgi:hypothetical protein